MYAWRSVLRSRCCSATGYKYGIVAGLGLYVLYVGSFIIADELPDYKWPAACTGGVIGGHYQSESASFCSRKFGSCVVLVVLMCAGSLLQSSPCLSGAGIAAGFLWSAQGPYFTR